MLLKYLVFGVIAFLMKEAQCKIDEVLAEAGSQAVLPCKWSPLSPNPSTIIWTQVNKGTVWRKQRSGLQYWGSSWTSNGDEKGAQRARCPHSLFERGDFSLQINNLREEDGGLYSCKVETEREVVEKVVRLIIIKVSIAPSSPMVGNDFSISCNVTPLTATTVRWLLNDNPYVTQTGRVMRAKASADLTGKWTCVVNYKGKEVRGSATLTVKGILQPSRDDTKVYTAVGSAVTLPCVFSPDLKPSRPVWEKLKPGTLPASFSTFSASSQTPFDKSASLKEVGFEDQGGYRCSATVRGQRLTRKMQLVVAKIDKSVPSKKSDSMTLTCQLSDPSEVTEYEWVNVVYDLNGTQSVRSVQKGKTLSISTVSEENHGEWTCRFYGKEGVLGNITYHIQLMSGLSGKKSSGHSNNTAPVVCLSLLLIVLLMVLVKMYMNYQRRKRIFQYPALETIVHSNSNERENRERSRQKT